MFPMQQDYPQTVSWAQNDAQARLAFLRKTYTYFTLSVLAASAGACASLYLGTGSSQLAMQFGESQIVMPPLVGFFANHWIIGGLLFLGSVMAASAVRRQPGVNAAALVGMGFMSGMVIAPAVWITQLMASQGRTLTASPVRDAFLLTLAGFCGLTAYAFVSKKDFSFLRGFVSMGLWVIIGAGLISIFVHSSVFALAIASGGVLLFGAFILYDTSRMIRAPLDQLDPAGAAISLYLSVLNLFLFLLQIFRGSSRD